MYQFNITLEGSRLYDVGSFTITGTTLRATDPTYADDSPHVLIPNWTPGEWQAVTFVSDTGIFGMCVVSLIAQHRSIRNPFRHAEHDAGEITVDAASAGFFDNATYFPADGHFASVIDREAQASAGPNGVISVSGIGDGRYPVTAYANKKGEVIAAGIDFIVAA